ncbi:cell division protein FtsA [Oricola cellulosilytica]|uniref:Cell division protein FtsA n=1 Tax=Oricola cellulosilytica TaxID=1429082 RepID=A0A4V2MNY2_9HYPH|nr:cell division protein FtsA [Oricola cellulosilytica]TCD15237.1 cell division protein FtsA [Oricola cellulosilytica]
MPVKRRGSDSRKNRRTGILTVLDLGSTKTVCMIARMVPNQGGLYLQGRSHDTEVIGIGHTRSHGVKSGLINDLDAAEQSIRHAVDAAERMANLTVDSMIVNISSGRLASQMSSASIQLDDRPITADDIQKVLKAGIERAAHVDRTVLHMLPVDHVLDGERGIVDPRGMIGTELALNMHVMTADAAPLRNIEMCVNRAHLSVEAMVATPYASGLAALVGDELDLGCACVDMGGGTTSVAIFADRALIHADSLPVGGHHVTMDIARGFSCRLEDAERLKVMQGSALATVADERDVIQIPGIGDDDYEGATQVPRSLLNRIIAARVEETLEMLRERINKSGYSSVVGKRVVLTGGAAQLTGLQETARRILGRNVRIGRPLGVSGLPASAKGPAFAAAAGLTIYPQVADNDQSSMKFRNSFRTAGTGTDGPLGRVTQWIRESF